MRRDDGAMTNDPSPTEGTTIAIRAAALTFTGDPFANPGDDCMDYLPDAILAMGNGKIFAFGPADEILAGLASDVVVERYPDSLILPGFIDCHVHYPQIGIIGAGGETLIDWLETFAFGAEEAFADTDHAADAASHFLDEMLRSGTTSAAVFCTVHAGSVDAIFEQATLRNMRILAGKVLMDRHAPTALTDTPESGYEDSKSLIERWHGKNRLHYCITPRFAPSCTPAQLEAAGALWSYRVAFPR